MAKAAPTVNDKEMAHFKYLSSFWWDENSVLHELHVLNDLRIPWIIDKLLKTNLITEEAAKSAKPLEGLNILDVGCGGGFATEVLGGLGCTVVGMDPCLEMIHVAKEHLNRKPDLSKNVTYICGSVEEHSEHNYEKYDVIFASEVIDHVDEQDLFLELCVKCLKPGGSIFITTFHKNWIAWFIVIVFFEYIIRGIHQGTHFWHRFISVDDVKKILSKCKYLDSQMNFDYSIMINKTQILLLQIIIAVLDKCKTESVKEMYYNIFLRKWSWGYFRWMTYALHAVKNNT